MIYFATISLHLQASSCIVFNGLKFFEWNEQVKLHLSVLNIDLLLLEGNLLSLIILFKEEKSKLKMWEWSNMLSLIFM